MALQHSVVRTGANPSRGVREQVRDIAGGGVSETVGVGSRILGGGEGEAEQPTLNVGGATSKNLASNHDWQSKECKVECCGGQRRKVDPPRT